MIGHNQRHNPVSIAHIPLASDHEAAYAAYYEKGSRYGSSLARIMVLNMRGYNTTVDGGGLDPVENPPKRNSLTYTFDVKGVRDGTRVKIQRLFAKAVTP